MRLGYWANWNADFGPEKIPWKLLTHANYAFLELNSDGSLKPFPDEARVKAFVSLARKSGVKSLLSVGGAESGGAFAAGGEELAGPLVATMNRYGFDGLDIDWEFPTSQSERAQLSALIRAIRKRLPDKKPPKGKLLTAALPGSDWAGRWMDATTLALALDFGNIMSYDAAGPWSAVAEHHAPMRFCESSVAYWTRRGWPKSRLNLGIPLYGRGFKASAFGQKPSGKARYAEVAWKELKALQSAGKLVESADGPTLLTEGGEIIGYDDSHSIRKKAAWARAQKLGGVFFWELSHDPAFELIGATLTG